MAEEEGQEKCCDPSIHIQEGISPGMIYQSVCREEIVRLFISFPSSCR